MDGNYLITGYWGEPHVTSENDRGINAGIVGQGKYVFRVGEMFRAEYIGNNTVRMYDGKLIDNGACAGIPAGEYIDFFIENASQGMNRNDLIVFNYNKNNLQIEEGRFYVISGNETSGTAYDPQYYKDNLLSGNADFDHMALWRVRVSTGTISQPEQVFEFAPTLVDVRTVDEGGTGIDEIGEGNFLVGNGKHQMAELTPEEVLAHIGGVSREEFENQDTSSYELLWENTGSGAFAAQTITVPGLENYHFALVAMSRGAYMMHNFGNIQSAIEWDRSEDYGMLNARCMRLGSNKIEFDDCYEIGVMNGMTTALIVNNSGCVPYGVFGVRGLYVEE